MRKAGMLLTALSVLALSLLTPLATRAADAVGPGVVINEISIKGDEWIELYNASAAPVSLEGWYLDDYRCGFAERRFGAVTLAPGAYLVVKPQEPGWSFYGMSGDGEWLRLCNANHGEVDRVVYGNRGGAPVAPYENVTARAPNGFDSNDDANDWTLDASPTPGRANDVRAPKLGSSLVINEVNNYVLPENLAVELYNPLTQTVNLRGWQLTDGDRWVEIYSKIEIPPQGLYVVPVYKYGLTVKKEDVLYLFDPHGVRVDQVGFTYEDWDYSFQRVPNGAGPHNGYHWRSTVVGNNWRYLPDSLGRLNVADAGPEGGLPDWSQNRATIGYLMQHFAEAPDVCALSDVMMAGDAALFDVRRWTAPDGRTPLDYLRAAVQKGKLSAREWACAILATRAVDENPRAFAGVDLVGALLATQPPDGPFGETQTLAYALLALRTAGAPLPPPLVAALVARRTADGGWALDGTTAADHADAATTALAVQALFAAGESDAARGGLEYLRRMQNAGGGFNLRTPGTERATDLAATALALQALYISGASLGEWTPHGVDPVGALLAPLPAGAAAPDLQTRARMAQALEKMTLLDVR